MTIIAQPLNLPCADPRVVGDLSVQVPSIAVPSSTDSGEAGR